MNFLAVRVLLSVLHGNVKKSSSGGHFTVDGSRKYFSPGCSCPYQVSPKTTQSTPDPRSTMVRMKLTSFNFSSQLCTRLKLKHVIAGRLLKTAINQFNPILGLVAIPHCWRWPTISHSSLVTTIGNNS